MTTFDPYRILGLGRTAGAAAIKGAYRRLVQTAHPDRGGDAEQFMALVKAFGLLSDPEARRLYDETGTIDDDGVRSFRRDVTVILADMFDAAVATAVATGLGLEEVNFVGEMRTAVTTSLADTRVTLGRTDRDIAALSSLRRRIRRKDAGANLFVERLDRQIADKEGQQATVRRRLMLLEAAAVELGNYTSEVELIAALGTD